MGILVCQVLLVALLAKDMIRGVYIYILWSAVYGHAVHMYLLHVCALCYTQSAIIISHSIDSQFCISFTILHRSKHEGLT